jgi:hypothetical protein
MKHEPKPYTKEHTLIQWNAAPPNQPILKEMIPIPYKSKGSSYGACGIRIDGTPEFIDAVLSNLKELIAGENGMTRLELSRQRVDGSKLGKEFHKKVHRAEVCYVRLHMRGDEAAHVNTMFGVMRQETMNFAAAHGLK